ncbi:HD domain-containing protein [Candidatus Dojkabacteria bacterium]|uniref:HD domain-containing protein n=1 Tax=Candidatus Dojkabacteria bacterium TaxID=2099670 RepID=A0A955L3B5_9BACT|nr:HD domain-containing protein [Candidatus Dojkabacteria bacterium]
MKVVEIYKKYNLMPNLQLHLKRVAAVSQLIVDNFDLPVNKENIVTACLLHDIGNIIKFKLKLFPNFLEPEGYEYWRKVQNNYIEKYGDDEHLASKMICKELGINNEIISIIECIGFRKVKSNVDTKNYDIKISAYSDTRVSITGIKSQKERWSEARPRYVKNKGKQMPIEDKAYEQHIAWHAELEQQIFKHCRIKPENINDKSAQKLVESFDEYEIKTNIVT